MRRNLARATSLLLCLSLLGWAGRLAANFDTAPTRLDAPAQDGLPSVLSGAADALRLVLEPGYYSLRADFSAAKSARRLAIYVLKPCPEGLLGLGCTPQWVPLTALESGADLSGGIPVQNEPAFLVLALRQEAAADGTLQWRQCRLLGSSLGTTPGAARPSRLSIDFDDGEGGQDHLLLLSAQD